MRRESSQTQQDERMLTEQAAVRPRSSFATSFDDTVSYQSYKSFASTKTGSVVSGHEQVITYSNYKGDIEKKRTKLRTNLILQVIIAILSFFLWCSSMFILISWLTFIQKKYFLDYMEQANTGNSVDFSLAGGLFGCVSSILMFFFSVKPLSLRRCPAGEERLEAIMIFLIFTFSLSIMGLLFVIRVQKHFHGDPPNFKLILKESLELKYHNEFGKTPANRFWDMIQYDLRCCGINGAQDWRTSKFTERTRNPYPVTCCMELDQYFDSVGQFHTLVYDSKAFMTTHYLKLREQLNHTCFRQQMLHYENGCGLILADFFDFLVQLFFTLDVIQCLVCFLIILMLPVAV